MPFKDHLAKDIRSTFINPEEFATLHKIDDQEMWVVVEETENEHPLTYAEGVSLSRVVLHVDAIELGYTPKEDQWIKFDEVRHRVVHVAKADGIFVITLEANTE